MFSALICYKQRDSSFRSPACAPCRQGVSRLLPGSLLHRWLSARHAPYLPVSLQRRSFPVRRVKASLRVPTLHFPGKAACSAALLRRFVLCLSAAFPCCMLYITPVAVSEHLKNGTRGALRAFGLLRGYIYHAEPKLFSYKRIHSICGEFCTRNEGTTGAGPGESLSQSAGRRANSYHSPRLDSLARADRKVGGSRSQQCAPSLSCRCADACAAA